MKLCIQFYLVVWAVLYFQGAFNLSDRLIEGLINFGTKYGMGQEQDQNNLMCFGRINITSLVSTLKSKRKVRLITYYRLWDSMGSQSDKVNMGLGQIKSVTPPLALNAPLVLYLKSSQGFVCLMMKCPSQFVDVYLLIIHFAS